MTGLEIEKEEYILTPEEEERAIGNAIRQRKEHAIWKMAQLKYSEAQIQDKLAGMDFNSQINRNVILQLANSSKQHDLWQKKQRERDKELETQRKKELEEYWTANRMFALMKHTSQNFYGKPFIVNGDNKKLITALCFFLSRDKRFEQELGYSFKKGLLIRGAAGIGKTFTVNCVKDNGLNPVQVLSMIEISDEVKQEGEYEIKMGNATTMYLDDVGTEEHIINHFGTKIIFFKNLIETVYLRSKNFNHLIISTNNSFSEIEEKYGFRVRSRMKEMFNILDVTGKDMRS